MSLNNVLSSSQLVVGQGTELTLGLLGLSTNCRRKDLLSLLKSRPISAVKSIIVYCTYQVWYIALCYHCIHASDICCNLASPVSTSEVLWMTSVFGEMCSWKLMISVDIWKRTASLLRYFFCSQVTVLFTFLSVHLWGYYRACATSCSAHSVRCKTVFIVSFMTCCGEVKSNEELLHWVRECRVTTVASQALIVPVSTSFFAATNFVWYALSFTARQCFFGAATSLPYCNLTDWSYFAISESGLKLGSHISELLLLFFSSFSGVCGACGFTGCGYSCVWDGFGQEWCWCCESAIFSFHL